MRDNLERRFFCGQPKLHHPKVLNLGQELGTAKEIKFSSNRLFSTAVMDFSGFSVSVWDHTSDPPLMTTQIIFLQLLDAWKCGFGSSGQDTKPCLVWFLNLPPGYCPTSSFSLHFFKKKIGENILNFFNCLIYLGVPNLWEKVINYRAHGSWCCLLGWRPHKLHEGKRNQRKQSQGEISMLCQAAASSPWQQGWLSSCWEKTALEREMS